MNGAPGYCHVVLMAAVVAACGAPSPAGVHPSPETVVAAYAEAKKQYPHVDLAFSYRVDSSWPADRIPGDTWGAMSSVAMGPDGNVWTFNRGKIPIQVYTEDGKLVRHWGGQVFKKPHTLRFDRGGNLWASDTGTHTVRKLSLGGAILLTLGVDGQRGADTSHLDEPTDQAFASNGDVYVTDGYGNDRVMVFDKAGTFLRTWGKLGHGPGEFSLPHSIAIDSRDRVYVADRNNARIQVFDAAGHFLTEWRNLTTPWSLLMTQADEVFVCGSSPMLWSEVGARYRMVSIPPKDQLFLKIDAEGRTRELWTLPKGVDGHEHPGDVNWVHTMAFGKDGGLYVGDIEGRRAQKFVRVGAPSGGH